MTTPTPAPPGPGANPFAGKVKKATWSGAAPMEDRDGITPEIAEQFLLDPHRIRIAVTLLDCVAPGGNFDREEFWPVLRKRQIEVIVRPEDIATVSECLGRAWADRIGSDQLDLGLTPGEVAAPPESAADKRDREAVEADSGGTVTPLRGGSGRQ